MSASRGGLGPPDGLLSQVRRWRHHLHQIPETAFVEHQTGAYVATVLSSLGYAVATGIGGTGLVGTLERGSSGRSVGLRSELDALPIEESTGLPYSSRNSGTMHACGHDGHMAMLLGASAVLAQDKNIDGTVRVIFQPAEEPGLGARAMIDDGLFDRFPVDRLFGLHNIPGQPVGSFTTRPGPIMASEDNFTIAVTGRGGHSSAPHLVIDPLVVASEIVLALQRITARTIDPLGAAVISCTDLVTDGARNAIPTHVTITGDTRSFDATVQDVLERRIQQVSAGVAAAHGASVEVTYTREFSPTLNEPVATDIAQQAARKALGADRVRKDTAPIMASEDFGVLAEQVPACLSLIGNGTETLDGGVPLHSHDYRYNDDSLPAGVAYFHRVVLESLGSELDAS